MIESGYPITAEHARRGRCSPLVPIRQMPLVTLSGLIERSPNEPTRR